jgi:UDP-N-acetylmuramate dehydrogenase
MQNYGTVIIMATDLSFFIEKINRHACFSGTVCYDEPLSNHTTFKVGGPADVWIRPAASCFPDYTAILMTEAQKKGVPVFILGGGANIVVADKGIRGIVLDTGYFTDKDIAIRQGSVVFHAGTPVDTAVQLASGYNLTGLEFLSGMPGTIGGAVWMNARCYECSVSDRLGDVTISDESGKRTTVPFVAEDYGYKKSPFQNRSVVILSAQFLLQPGEPAAIQQHIAAYRADRLAKGHYQFPCAGSVFKNSRYFGKATGKLIDELGLRGLCVGGAAVAPFHGNIIINTGAATAADIRNLVDIVTDRVKTATGFELETEILFVGAWD